MYSQALLVVVAVGLCSSAAGYGLNGELIADIEQLKADVAQLQKACHGQVHVHVHGDASEEEHHDDTDAVNVNLNLHLDDKPHHEKEEQYAHCVMSSHGAEPEIHGHLFFSQHEGEDHAQIVLKLFGFPDHGLLHHVDFHTLGTVSKGCGHLGPEFDPYHTGHGAIGLLVTDEDGHISHNISKTTYTMFGWDSIIGRSVVVDDKDGAPLGCCSIVRVSAEDVAHEMEVDHQEEIHLAHYHEELHDPHAAVHYAHCEMDSHDATPKIHGHLYFEEHGDDDHVKIDMQLFGFADHNQTHHLTIHEYGHAEEGCSDVALGHEYAPTQAHGGQGDILTAVTDLDGHIKHTFQDSKFTMKGSHNILGRSVVVDDATHRWLACCNIIHATEQEVQAEKEAEHHEEEALAHYTGKHDDTAYAHCLMNKHDDESGLDVHGTIHITQHKGDEKARIDVEMFNFTDHNKPHHLTVHTSGNLKDGCGAVGIEYDPYHKGSGLIGTVTTDADGHITDHFESQHYTLSGSHPIIGRSIVIDDDEGNTYACCAVGWSTAKEHDAEVLADIHEAEALEHHEDHHVEHEEEPPLGHDIADDTVYGHCNFAHHGHGDSTVHGHLHLIQHEGEAHAEIEVDLFGFEDHDTDHHIIAHTNGHIGDSCANLGPEFDPDHEGHDGSIATVTTDADGHVQHSIPESAFSMEGFHSIIGRSAVVDDKDGNPVACCVFTWSNAKQYAEEMEADHHEAEALPHHQRRRKRSAVHPKLAAKIH